MHERRLMASRVNVRPLGNRSEDCLYSTPPQQLQWDTLGPLSFSLCLCVAAPNPEVGFYLGSRRKIMRLAHIDWTQAPSPTSNGAYCYLTAFNACSMATSGCRVEIREARATHWTQWRWTVQVLPPQNSSNTKSNNPETLLCTSRDLRVYHAMKCQCLIRNISPQETTSQGSWTDTVALWLRTWLLAQINKILSFYCAQRRMMEVGFLIRCHLVVIQI